MLFLIYKKLKPSDAAILEFLVLSQRQVELEEKISQFIVQEKKMTDAQLKDQVKLYSGVGAVKNHDYGVPSLELAETLEQKTDVESEEDKLLSDKFKKLNVELIEEMSKSSMLYKELLALTLNQL